MPILVISNSEHSLVAEIANGITVDFAQPENAYATIIANIQDINIACVLATDDSCVELCSRIADYLGLPQNRAAAALLTQRKDLGRDALAMAGCNTPEYQVVAIDDCSPASLQVSYPLVVKPLTGSYSYGTCNPNRTLP